MLDFTKQFSTAFQQAIDNIHSVAQEFERMDNELQKLFADVTTYVKVKW